VNRPDTTLGQALAGRALALAERQRRTATVTMETAGGLLDLTTPEPVGLPEHVRTAAKAALDRGETHYTVRPGVPELRAALARRSTADGFPATVDGAVVTNGGAEALYIALQSTLKPGDTALLAGPVAPNIVEMIEFIGARAERLPLIGDRLTPDPDALAGASAAVLLLASPSPVTGVALAPGHLATIANAALDRGMAVVLDRSLAWCGYDSDTAPFPDPDLGSRILTTGSFSTAYGLAGWRVGYFSAPPERIAAMRELKQAMSICTSAVAQYAALAALEGPDDWLAARRTLFARRRERLMAALATRGQRLLPPDAWPPVLLDMRWAGDDDVEIARRMAVEDGLLVEPAARYGAALEGFVRIDLRVPDSIFGAFIARVSAQR
jgi:aspartate aminotransferase